MHPITARQSSAGSLPPEISRLDFLDATRAFALVLGIVFHACLSFTPSFMGWAVQDISTSPLVGMFFTVSHSFRMETFFLLAGFFAHVMLHRKGTADFVRSRAIRIGVPFVVGWFLLRPLLVSGWIMGSASLRGDYHFWPGIRDGFESLKSLPAGIFTGSHLWFLYYLALITAMTLVLRGVMKLSGSWGGAMAKRSDGVVAWLAHSRLSLPVLVIPTAVTLWFMRFWAVDTPDQTLLPNLPVTLLYGGFFLLGWMFGRQPDAITGFVRLTPERWILAGVGIAATILLGGIEQDPGHPHYAAAHVEFAASYAVTMWSLVSLTIGVFKKSCSEPRLWTRYVADSSYWLYLIHLPIVVWLQVAFAEVHLHWSVKLAFITTITLAVALLSYDLFVRSTWIGWILNGRRRERAVTPFVLRTVRLPWRGKQLRPATATGRPGRIVEF